MYQTNYHRPSSLAEAVSLFSGADDAAYLSGGHTLIPTMKQRLAAPSDLIDLAGLADLKGIEASGGTVTIGAASTHAEVAAADAVRGAIPALADLAGSIGDPHVRNRGTIGGSLANNDPAADYPSAALALAATIHTDKRQIEADDFFNGLFETTLAPGEIVTKITFKVPAEAGYGKFRNPASRYPMAGVFIARQADGSVRVAVTGAGNTGVYRWSEAESALSGTFSADALSGLSVDAGAMMSDLHGSAEYRANLVKVMAARAVANMGGATIV
ncbi:MAG: xanthine dehydrogenase family protein subunit M [Alphaproteobacteria bacterium]|nr:MAG: xanthine dehydrogenase family protein subunit M [Alphaproteobacteria bacterium]